MKKDPDQVRSFRASALALMLVPFASLFWPTVSDVRPAPTAPSIAWLVAAATVGSLLFAALTIAAGAHRLPKEINQPRLLLGVWTFVVLVACLVLVLVR